MSDLLVHEQAERIARAFHEAYERLAPDYEYTTREESARPWEQVPRHNRILMVAVVDELLSERVIALASHVEREPGDALNLRVGTEGPLRNLPEREGRMSDAEQEAMIAALRPPRDALTEREESAFLAARLAVFEQRDAHEAEDKELSPYDELRIFFRAGLLAARSTREGER